MHRLILDCLDAAARFSFSSFFDWAAPPLTESTSVSRCLSESAFELLPWYSHCLQVICCWKVAAVKKKKGLMDMSGLPTKRQMGVISLPLIILTMNYTAYLGGTICINVCHQDKCVLYNYLLLLIRDCSEISPFVTSYFRVFLETMLTL